MRLYHLVYGENSVTGIFASRDISLHELKMEYVCEFMTLKEFDDKVDKDLINELDYMYSQDPKCAPNVRRCILSYTCMYPYLYMPAVCIRIL